MEENSKEDFDYLNTKTITKAVDKIFERQAKNDNTTVNG